jgi:hypothetical protein
VYLLEVSLREVIYDSEWAVSLDQSAVGCEEVKTIVASLPRNLIINMRRKGLPKEFQGGKN